MSKSKDVSEKILEDYNDVFADIVNNLVFDGLEIVRADELENAVTVSQIKLDDGIHEQERDTAKHWRRGTIIMAAWGLENQSVSDSEMPLRVVSYDGAVYKNQVNHRHSARRQGQEPNPFYPSITIVLYFGTTRWSGPKDLKSCFSDMPEELERLVPDYPIHIIEVAFLSPEQLGKLKSDFRYVADYLVQTRTSGEYVSIGGEIVHVDETLKLLGAITGDRRFQEAMSDVTLAGKEQITMSDVIDSYIARGREEGREETRKKYEAVLAEKDRALEEKNRAMRKMEQELRELRARYGQA